MCLLQDVHSSKPRLLLQFWRAALLMLTKQSAQVLGCHAAISCALHGTVECKARMQVLHGMHAGCQIIRIILTAADGNHLEAAKLVCWTRVRT
jgi:hypothetical protein